MTKEEYKEKKEQAKKEFNAKIHLIDLQYTAANNPYKIGDLVTDHFHTIKIEVIKHGFKPWGERLPCCIYRGKGVEMPGKVVGSSDEPIYQYNIIN